MRKKISKLEVCKYILKLSKPFYFNLSVVFFVVLIDSFLNSFNPYLLKLIINSISRHKTNKSLNVVLNPVILFVGSKFLLEIIWRVHNYFYLGKMLPKFRQLIYQFNFAKLLNKSYKFFEDEYSGKLSYSIPRLTKYIPEIISTIFERFLNQVLTIIVAFYFLSRTNIKYSLLLLLLIFLFIILVVIFNDTLTEKSKKLASSNSKAAGILTDIFVNILPVKLFANNEYEKQIIKDTTDISKTKEKKLFNTYFIFVTIAAAVIILFEIVALLLLLKDWQKNLVSLGDFGFIIFLNNSITHMLWYNLRIVSDFTQTFGETQEILSYIYLPIELKDKPNAKNLKVIQGEIEFKNVQFKYDKSLDYIFKNFSMKIKPKEKLGIVGFSGGGKSTLLKLILRLYDIQKGQILIDGQKISDVTQNSLRQNIGLIPQDSSLFHRSILENLKYGKPNATLEEIKDAAKKAYAHNFISSLPERYNSYVGERGVKISGGQKQRITIARIILKNAPILILDEATSALDTITERSIQKAIDFLMQNKTTIVIAHRLSTLQKMDRIIVLNKGNIIEEGSHEELIQKKNLYKKLWDSQVNGFISDDGTI